MADKPDDRYPDSEGPFAGPNNTFPIKDKAHVENAWARIHQGPTRANHSAAEIADIIGKIQARAKELGIELGDSVGAAARSVPLEDDTIERRVVLMAVELRALDGAEGSRTIVGYAAVFDRDSRMIPRGMGSGYIESLVPTFFEEARSAGWPGQQGSGVMCRYNHNDQYLLGTTQAGTCQLSVDRTGLEYRIPDMPRCRDDVLEMIGRGDCNRSSFTFMDAQDDWSYRGGVTHRTLISGGILDVAPVSAVAGYQDTSVSLRSLAAFKDVPVDDVYALAKRHELRQLFTITDQAPPVPVPVDAPTVTVVDPNGVVHVETLVVAPAEPVEAPQLELPLDEPRGMSYYDATLRLHELRYPPTVPTTAETAETERKVRL